MSLDEAKNVGNTVVLARLFNEVQAQKMPSRMVRLILSEYLIDTNILLSSLRRTARNRPIFDAIRTGEITIAVTTEILLEYIEIIGERTTREIGENVSQLVLNLVGTERIDLKFRFKLIKADPDDNKFVDCAIASNAELIVANDKHFNELKKIAFPKVATMNSEEFLVLLDKLKLN